MVYTTLLSCIVGPQTGPGYAGGMVLYHITEKKLGEIPDFAD